MRLPRKQGGRGGARPGRILGGRVEIAGKCGGRNGSGWALTAAEGGLHSGDERRRGGKRRFNFLHRYGVNKRTLQKWNESIKLPSRDVMAEDQGQAALPADRPPTVLAQAMLTTRARTGTDESNPMDTPEIAEAMADIRAEALLIPT